MATNQGTRQLDVLTSLVQDEYDSIQQQVLANIIKRLNEDSLDKLERDNVLKWQIKKLKELGLLTDETIKMIEGKVNKTHDVVDNVMSELGSQINDNVEGKLVKVTGKRPKTNEIDHLMQNYARIAKDSLDNHINESLLTRNSSDSSVAKAYRDILQGMVAKVLTGAQQPREALQQTVYDWQDKGMSSSLVDKAGRQWNLQTYADMVMNSIIPQAYAQTVKSRMDDYGYHLVVYPEYPAAREACAPIQGKVVNLVEPGNPEFNKKYDSVFNHGFGDPGGALGINCRHWHFTVFDPDTMEEPKQTVNPEDAIKQEKLVQNQRRMERAIRLSKSKLKAAEELHDDVGISHYKGLIRTQQAAIRYYVKNTDGLVRQYQREQTVKKKILNKNSTIDDLTDDQKYTRTKITNGEWGITINPEKQAPHMESTHIEGKSYFRDDVDTQGLLDKYAGTGHLNETRLGYGNKELVKNINVPGCVVTKSGKKLPITGITIHHSKKRTHIVPYTERSEE